MAASMIPDAVLSAGAVATVIMLLGAVFLLILQTPRFQYSLRFLVITIGCIAVALGLWTAIWRTMAGPARSTLPTEWDTEEYEPSGLQNVPGAKPGPRDWNEYMDGPYQPTPQEPDREPSR